MGRLAGIGRLLATIVLTAGGSSFASAASAVEPGEMPWCPKEAGMIQGPYVPTRQTAMRIYLAVRAAIAPRQAREFDIPRVIDYGDSWAVYYTKREFEPRVIKRRGGKELVVTAGGGMLDMRIDKCTGRVLALHYSR